MDWATVTDARDDATPPTRIPMITRPARVQMIAKIRAGIERGDRSPYLSAEKKKHHYHTSSTSVIIDVVVVIISITLINKNNVQQQTKQKSQNMSWQLSF